MFNTNETQLYKQKYSQGDCARLFNFVGIHTLAYQQVPARRRRNVRRRFPLRPPIHGRMSQGFVLLG